MVVIVIVQLFSYDYVFVVLWVCNVSGNIFELKVQNLGGLMDSFYDVYFVVVQAGKYQVVYDGVIMEVGFVSVFEMVNIGFWWFVCEKCEME